MQIPFLSSDVDAKTCRCNFDKKFLFFFSNLQTKNFLQLKSFFPWIILFHHSLFRLKALESWWSLLRTPPRRMSTWYWNIWFLSLTPQVRLGKRVDVFMIFFRKHEFLDNQVLQKKFFLTTEHGILTSVNTHCDRVRSMGKAFSKLKTQISSFKRE